MKARRLAPEEMRRLLFGGGGVPAPPPVVLPRVAEPSQSPPPLASKAPTTERNRGGRPPSLNPRERQIVAELAGAGWSCQRIARQHGVHPDTVRNVLGKRRPPKRR